MSQAIIPGSLQQIASQNQTSIAETFLSCDAVIIVDTSGSMESCDSRQGKSRYEVALEELTRLQENMPGKLAVIAFSSTVEFCPSGVPTPLRGGTDLTKALKFTKVADLPGMQFILISDGQPEDEHSALQVATSYQNKIDVIYVGPEGGRGQAFLLRLAQATGGLGITADRAQELAPAIDRLLLHS